MLPRLKPRTFYDIVIQVAIVRPGPIQGDMVHPYLRRREGMEPVDYPTPELRRVLEKTLGVPLFQEQAMQVAIVCAGFTPSEADALRRSMATFKFTGGVHHFRDKMIAGMVERGYTREFAEKTFSQIEGFGSYGFPESHAASFALIAYASAWLKCHHPDVFCCALLNAQPMGFYAPAQIVRDARLHGVEVRPVCVNASRMGLRVWNRRRGRYLAVRLGLRMAKGLSSAHADEICSKRRARTVSLGRGCVAARARAGGGAGTPGRGGCVRRTGIGSAAGAMGDPRPVGCAAAVVRCTRCRRPATPSDGAAETCGSESCHAWDGGHRTPRRPPPHDRRPRGGGRLPQHRPVACAAIRCRFLRADLHAQRIVRCADLAKARDGQRLTVAGIVLVRQRPGSARGVLFITIEDETGHANLIVWPSVFDRQRRLVLTASMLACRGKVQREGEVIHVIADHLTDFSPAGAASGGVTEGFRWRTGGATRSRIPMATIRASRGRASRGRASRGRASRGHASEESRSRRAISASASRLPAGWGSPSIGAFLTHQWRTPWPAATLCPA